MLWCARNYIRDIRTFLFLVYIIFSLTLVFKPTWKFYFLATIATQKKPLEIQRSKSSLVVANWWQFFIFNIATMALWKPFLKCSVVYRWIYYPPFVCFIPDSALKNIIPTWKLWNITCENWKVMRFPLKYFIDSKNWINWMQHHDNVTAISLLYLLCKVNIFTDSVINTSQICFYKFLWFCLFRMRQSNSIYISGFTIIM